MKTVPERIAAVVAALGLAGWVGSFAYFMHLQSSSPATPVPSSDQIVEERNHGKRFYVTSTEDAVLEYGRIGSWIVLMAGVGTGLYLRRADLQKNKNA